LSVEDLKMTACVEMSVTAKKSRQKGDEEEVSEHGEVIDSAETEVQPGRADDEL